MAINWTTVGRVAGVLVALVTALLVARWASERDRGAGLTQEAPLAPLATGFASIPSPAVARHECHALPLGVRLADHPTTKAWMDRHFHAADWTAISERMAAGDDIYAYETIVHPLHGTGAFAGNGGGYLVLRGWCLVGQMGVWVE